MRRKFINEIAQHPKRFRQDSEQVSWLENFRDVTQDMLRYRELEGVILDAELFASGVKGRYFLN